MSVLLPWICPSASLSRFETFRFNPVVPSFHEKQRGREGFDVAVTRRIREEFRVIRTPGFLIQNKRTTGDGLHGCANPFLGVGRRSHTIDNKEEGHFERLAQ